MTFLRSKSSSEHVSIHFAIFKPFFWTNWFIERRKYYDNETKYVSINKKLYKSIENVLERNMEEIVENEGLTREDFDYNISRHQNEEVSDAINSLCVPKM